MAIDLPLPLNHSFAKCSMDSGKVENFLYQIYGVSDFEMTQKKRGHS